MTPIQAAFFPKLCLFDLFLLMWVIQIDVGNYVHICTRWNWSSSGACCLGQAQQLAQKIPNWILLLTVGTETEFSFIALGFCWLLALGSWWLSALGPWHSALGSWLLAGKYSSLQSSSAHQPFFMTIVTCSHCVFLSTPGSIGLASRYPAVDCWYCIFMLLCDCADSKHFPTQHHKSIHHHSHHFRD